MTRQPNPTRKLKQQLNHQPCTHQNQPNLTQHITINPPPQNHATPSRENKPQNPNTPQVKITNPAFEQHLTLTDLAQMIQNNELTIHNRNHTTILNHINNHPEPNKPTYNTATSTPTQ